MKYIRTKDGYIVDVGAFIKNEKTNKYYKDHIFDEIKNRDDECYLHWTAIGTEENTIEGQRGARCDFEVYISSPFIKQADTIEELCDCFVDYDEEYGGYLVTTDKTRRRNHEIYAAIWTSKGLIYVAKMNDEGELELL